MDFRMHERMMDLVRPIIAACQASPEVCATARRGRLSGGDGIATDLLQMLSQSQRQSHDGEGRV